MTKIQNNWIMYYLTTARIPGEKAHSLQTIKNVDELRSEKCDMKIFAAKRKNDFKVDENIKKHFHLKNDFKVEYVTSFSNLTNNKKIQGLMFLVLNFSFAFFSFIKILNDNTNKKKIIFLRDTALLKPILYMLKFKKFPIIFELHDLPRTKKDEKKIFLYKKCDLIFTTSYFQKKVLVDKGINKEKIVDLMNGYDPTMFENIEILEPNLKSRLGLEKNKKIIMYAGSLAPWKGVDFILKSADFTEDDIVFVIIGGNPDEINILKQKFSKNLKKIKFVGFVPHRQIPLYLNEADILVHYTKPGGGELGSFSPIKLLEYMAAGKPILAVSEPWIKEIISEQKNGLTYDSKSPKDLGEKIMELIRNQIFMNELGKQAKIDVTKFSYSNRSKKIIQNINKMLSSKNIKYN